MICWFNEKNIPVIGGTSGVGLELAKHYVNDGHVVCVTGSKDPEFEQIHFQKLTITSDANQLVLDLNRIVDGFTNVNTLNLLCRVSAARTHRRAFRYRFAENDQRGSFSAHASRSETQKQARDSVENYVDNVKFPIHTPGIRASVLCC